MIFDHHDETLEMWIELSNGDERIWRGLTRTLAGALFAHNSEKKNGREIALRQLLVAVLLSSRVEPSEIAETLDVSEKTVERDRGELRRLAEARRQATVRELAA